jgi:hypothetical protein
VTSADRKYFEQLLAQVSTEFRKKHPETSAKIEEWKGEDIAFFRDELYEKVGASISEKWFYTHVKTQQEKLPRIDAINVIAQYAGYKGWKHFLNENAAEPVEVKAVNKLPLKLKYAILASTILAIAIILYQNYAKPTTYSFCFIDKTTHLPIKDSGIQLQLILENETPKNSKLINNCFQGEGEYVEFQVKGNYYKPQLVKRNILTSNYHENVMLASDDYARIIHIFSTSNVKDWKTRRNQLKEMIHDNAKIYYLSEEGVAIELYNKKEFVNQLTLPTRSLKSIKIVESEYEGDKISTMKFMR